MQEFRYFSRPAVQAVSHLNFVWHFVRTVLCVTPRNGSGMWVIELARYTVHVLFEMMPPTAAGTSPQGIVLFQPRHGSRTEVQKFCGGI